MALNPGFLSAFPWEGMGSLKYVYLAPFVAMPLLKQDDADGWCYHMCIIMALRYVHAAVWNFLARYHAVSSKHKIQDKPIEFKQVDREEHWDDYIILQAWVATLVHRVLPGFSNFAAFRWADLAWLTIWHAGPTEFVYYWFHRLLHVHSIYAKYHSHHHKSFVTEPISGSCHPFLEHLGYTANFAIPLLGTWMCTGGSTAMFYIYLLGFDLLNCIGHCNFEVVPRRLFQLMPWLKYLIYTSSYHSLHHSRVHTNFCLFMPLYDYMYGTVDRNSDTLFEEASTGREVKAPDMVFMAHGTEILSVFHLAFMSRSFSSRPYLKRWTTWLLYPFALLSFVLVPYFCKPFTTIRCKLRGLTTETWCMPRYAIHYFLKREHKAINGLLAEAIRKADQDGVKVIGLGALNKAENLNCGGELFVHQMPKLKIRVVHGNTLTAACILNEIDASTKEVFLTGATSKLGRAIALYLARKNIDVLMLTSARHRFDAIAEECDPEHRVHLKHVTSMAQGKQCKTWIVGKWVTKSDQKLAPAGTHFHQFVVPPIQSSRTDCTYGTLASMRLPDDYKGMHCCEMTMERR